MNSLDTVMFWLDISRFWVFAWQHAIELS